MFGKEFPINIKGMEDNINTQNMLTPISFNKKKIINIIGITITV